MKPTFSITVTLTSKGETPLEATKNALERIKQEGDTFIFNVENDTTQEKFIVDLDTDSVEIDND